MNKIVLVTLFVTPLFAACATTRVVSTKPRNGGVIALQKGLWGEAEARMKAESIMRSTCGGKYEITEEGEVVIGTVSQQQGSANETKTNGRYGAGSSTQTSSTVDTTNKTEWRITYACRS